MAKSVLSNIDTIIKRINKKYSDGDDSTGIVLRASKTPHAKVARLTTGVFALDVALGGGLPVGRISRFFGEYSGGKTTLALKVIAEAQRKAQGGDPFLTLWVDAEHVWDERWAKKLGVDPEYVTLIKPQTTEQAMDALEELLAAHIFDLVVVDSVAALTPMAEVEASVSGSSRVLTRKDGRISHAHIKDLVGTRFETPAVVDGAVEWCQVSKVWEVPEKKHTFKLKTKYGRELSITEDHSLYRVAKTNERKHPSSNMKIWDGELELVKGDEISVGDHVLLTNIPNDETVEWIDVVSLQGEADSNYNRCHVGNLEPDLVESCSSIPGRKYMHRDGPFGPHLPLEHCSSVPNNAVLYYTGGKAQAHCASRLPVEAVAFAFGLYLGDGSRKGSTGVQYAIAADRALEVTERLESDLGDFVGPGVWSSKRNHSECFDVVLGCKPLRKVFDAYFGSAGSRTKRIPNEVFSWTSEAKRKFLEGYLAADGYRSNRLVITSVNKELVEDTAVLLRQLGLVPSVGRQAGHESCIDGRTIPAVDTYSVSFRKSDWDGAPHRKKSSIYIDGGLPVKVVSIEKSAEPETVYDLCVPGPESFVANGILVHNSAEDWQMGLHARLINKAIRKWTSAMQDSSQHGKELTMILINQLRSTMDQYNPTTTPGGRGQVFASSLDLRLERKKVITGTGKTKTLGEAAPNKGDPVAAITHFLVTKNKTGPAQRTGEFTFWYQLDEESGRDVGDVDSAAAILVWGLRSGAIVREGREYIETVNGENLGTNKEHVESKLNDDRELSELLVSKILDLIDQ